MNKRSMQRVWAPVLGVAMIAAVSVRAQAPEQSAPPPATQTAPAPAPAQSPVPYQPKFAGDPARSESEAQALGYMRVVLRAQKEYKKRHNKFAESLPALAGTGSLTKRMARSNEFTAPDAPSIRSFDRFFEGLIFPAASVSIATFEMFQRRTGCPP